MISLITEDFQRLFADLPPPVQKQVRAAYKLFQTDPHHPSLRFKKLPPFDDVWSARIAGGYRAVGRWRGDVIVWFFVGSHTDYERVLSRLDP